MRRSLLPLFAAACAVCALIPAAASASTKVQLRHTSAGTILTDGHGFTLYMFTRDARNRDRCVTISGCRSVWPLAVLKGSAVAGSGVRRSLLGSIKVGGSRQVTYAGHPLYTYIGDSGPGSTGYIGFQEFGGTWYALSASGKAVR
jgi:predicted lipoprotein with Yx(FWY)xxD motif